MSAATEVRFDPLVQAWFDERFEGPTPPQKQGWNAIAGGSDTLIAAPTGSGKTLAAFLWALDRLVRSAREGALPERTQVVYVSPLKALGNDIEKNLDGPLGAIQAIARDRGVDLEPVRVAVRSGDTPQSIRQSMLRHPPHVLITTPESLYILLTAEKSREMLSEATTVIVDEIHAIAGDKRGAHLALSLERLDRLVGHRLQRIGLSATQKPIDEIARLLVGTERAGEPGPPRCEIVDTGHKRAMELSIETTDMELGAIASHELRATIYERICHHIGTHRTTIVFVNTRRLVERVAHELAERLGPDRVVAHHGSLSRKIRLAAEQKLKDGEVPVVVATASLELGIDVGHVDLVIHLGAPRALATLLQRVGRSGHWLGSVPKGVFFPLTRDELLQTAGAVRAIRAGELDRIHLASKPLDILAQQVVATAASEDIPEAEMRALVRRAYPYRDLTDVEYEDVLVMVSEGVSTRRGRRSAHLHRDRVQMRLRGRRGARLAAITSGGAIPDTADYQVIEDHTEARIGTLNEDFAIESMAGDIFLLGNHSWRINRVEAGKVRVQDAGQTPPTIPFWLGEAPARTLELSTAVSDLRQQVADRRHDTAAAVEWVAQECGIDRSGAEQIVDYVADCVAALGVVPTDRRVVAERFFDESGGMQLVLHAPFGGAINRALGLALRKNFCVSFDFELQAAATDDGVVISLGEQHSFPLDSVFGMVRPEKLEADLTQAALQSPMFTNRWRWNITRALALLRHQGGRRVPMNIQRMRADDMLAAVFPAQAACGDNHAGPIEPPDHPLVDETLRNCLYEAMDTAGLRRLLQDMRSGAVETIAIETSTPSPMAHEILNASPYAFLDDAPLEERRARAVQLRRTDASLADGIGALDDAAIVEVRRQSWPDVRDADELHDVLLDLVWLDEKVLGEWQPWLDELLATRRVGLAVWEHEGHAFRAIVPAERVAVASAAMPSGARFERAVDQPSGCPVPEDAEAAVTLLVRGWMEVTGPTSTAELAQRLGLARTRVEIAMARLEADGVVLQGRFTPGAIGEEWCERRLLSRIHRLTLGRLRREIEPVPPADFMRFLFRWQHLAPGTRLHGRDGLLAILRQLHGVEIAAPAWEESVLPARLEDYEGKLLDELCFAGLITWGRISRPAPETRAAGRRRGGPSRNAPLALPLREDLDLLLEAAGPREESTVLSSPANRILEILDREGASFLPDIARAAGMLPAAVEESLWELVARGSVTGDGFAGLRALLKPSRKAVPNRRLRALPGGRSRSSSRLLPVGRWSRIRRPESELDDALAAEEHLFELTGLLLRRYGVLFREVLQREACAPPWRAVLGILRRMEARGEIRGGRFVSGFIGEQFASVEAIEAMRQVRRRDSSTDEEPVLVSAADPLNLVGILTNGSRISPLSGQTIGFVRGVPTEIGELARVRQRLQAS